MWVADNHEGDNLKDLASSIAMNAVDNDYGLPSIKYLAHVEFREICVNQFGIVEFNEEIERIFCEAEADKEAESDYRNDCSKLIYGRF